MKTNGKRLILLAIILFLLIPVFTSAGKRHTESDVLSLMLKELNGKYLEGDFNMGGVILDEFISKEVIEALGDEIKTKLSLVGEEVDPNRFDLNLDGKYYSKERTYEENFNHLGIYGYDLENNPITIMISSYFSPEYDNGETTLFINLIKGGKSFNISGIIDRIESIFSKFNKSVEITTCIIGTIDGKLKETDLKKSVTNSMKKIKAKTVESYFDDSISSYTAYTPLIENFIFSGDKKVNLNLAIRYNEYENKTYFWIGTPIITTGY